MQQPDLPTDETIVVVHTARSVAEAMIVRGLLESAGIASPELGGGNPALWPDAVSILRASRGIAIPIYAIESQAAEARETIAEYLAQVEREPESDGEIHDGGEDA